MATVLNWDPSNEFGFDESHEYVLQRLWLSRAVVTILFESGCPSARELLALRNSIPSFSDVSLADVKVCVGQCSSLVMDELPEDEAQGLADKAHKAGLTTVVESTSRYEYLVFDQTNGCGLLIEDDSKSAALKQRMLAAGVQVQDI